MRGDGVIKVEIEKLHELLSRLEQRAEWDSLFDSGKIVQELDGYKDQVRIYFTISLSLKHV